MRRTRSARMNILGLVILASLIGLDARRDLWAFSEPTEPPPGGNVSPPLNVSAATQTKLGGLNIQGSVGIGTGLPGQKLDVVGGNVRSDTGFCIGSSCLTAWPVSGGGTLTGGGTLNYLSKWTSGTGLGNSLLYDDGTNVGIGILAPTHRLDIGGGKLRIRSMPSCGKLFTDTDGVVFCGIDATGGSGTVTSVGSGPGLTGGPITTSGTLSIDTAVVPRLNATNDFSAELRARGGLTVGFPVTGASGGDLSIAGTMVSGTVPLERLSAPVPRAVESLRIIRGTVSGNGTVFDGSGFSSGRVSGQPTGYYRITWDTPFSGGKNPSVVATYADFSARTISVVDASANFASVQIRDASGTLKDASFFFIAIGPAP